MVQSSLETTDLNKNTYSEIRKSTSEEYHELLDAEGSIFQYCN
jgi:hypothetical protein